MASTQSGFRRQPKAEALAYLKQFVIACGPHTAARSFVAVDPPPLPRPQICLVYDVGVVAGNPVRQPVGKRVFTSIEQGWSIRERRRRSSSYRPLPS